MKEKNCVDLKMEAYCQAVRDLEGKFHGLELHHVLSDYNKATDHQDSIKSQAGAARVFVSDQHTPSV
jgi:hypothetical protein